MVYLKQKHQKCVCSMWISFGSCTQQGNWVHYPTEIIIRKTKNWLTYHIASIARIIRFHKIHINGNLLQTETTWHAIIKHIGTFVHFIVNTKIHFWSGVFFLVNLKSRCATTFEITTWTIKYKRIALPRSLIFRNFCFVFG